MSRQYTQVSTEESAFIATSIRFENEAELSIRGDGKYSYAYGPRGLNGLLVNAFAFRCALFASLGGLTFGYDQGVIANILVMKDFVERWPITPWQKGVMSELKTCATYLLIVIIVSCCPGAWSPDRSPCGWSLGG